MHSFQSVRPLVAGRVRSSSDHRFDVLDPRPVEPRELGRERRDRPDDEQR
jgi:hypothetical protein